MSQVVVGGTFNVFHKGHAKLLDLAIITASFREAVLKVGITSDSFAQSSRSVPVRPYKERLNDVERYVECSDLRPRFGPTIYTIIDDGDYMPEMDEDDVLVVSEETEERARRILADKGYICTVKVVPMVRDKNGEEIHSTRILEGKE